jgi:hypothetical protein
MFRFTFSLLQHRGFAVRVASRLLLVTALGSHILPAQQLAAADSVPPAQTSPTPDKSSSPSINIQYTGRLFGYYRIEPDADAVEAKEKALPAAGRAVPLAAPAAFLRERQKTPSDLLLGMGDNFGPEFGASIQKESPRENDCRLDAPAWVQGQLDTYAPESLYKSEWRKPIFADCDNVTRFLMAAGYRAVVPGREDFLYSGTWLRRIAYLLRGASDSAANSHIPLTAPSSDRRWTVDSIPEPDGKCEKAPCTITSNDHKLHMLSANLRVKVASKNDKPDAANNNPCPLLFAIDLGAPAECGQTDSTLSAPMSWLARVDGALKPDIHASILNQALSSNSFATQLIKNEISILRTIVNGTCGPPPYISEGECKSLKSDLHDLLDSKPDATTAARSSGTKAQPAEFTNPPCAYESENDPKISDLARVVHATTHAKKFLSSHDGSSGQPCPFVDASALRSTQHLLLQLIYNEQLDTGFTIATIPSGDPGSPAKRRVLIVGVAGKETMQEVAPDFFTVYPDNFDCLAPAKQPPANPVCALKQKVFPSQYKAVSPADYKARGLEESVFFKQAVSGPGKAEPFQIIVGDPLVAAEAVLRAVWAHETSEDGTVDIDRTILMAQMPAAEAEEVGAQLRYDFGLKVTTMFDKPDLSRRPRVDLVLSEAQSEHISGNQVADINPLRSTVVLSPPLAYESVFNPDWYAPSTATIKDSDSLVRYGIQIENKLGFISDSSTPGQGEAKPTAKTRVATTAAQAPEDTGTSIVNPSRQATYATTASLLESMIETNLESAGITPPRLADLIDPWKKCAPIIPNVADNCQNQALTNYLLHTLQIHYKTSIAMLKRRDFWFGELAPGYDDYTVCKDWAQPLDSRINAPHDAAANAYCELHVALDRVLWRGDYAVRVLVDGTTLTSVLKSSAQATSIETTLLANDLHDEWLSIFGVVSKLPTNLVAAASGPESFSLPGASDCSVAVDPPLGKKSAGPAPVPYCVDGFTVATDAAYWITTSTQLAEDQATYKDIQAFTKPGGTHLVANLEKSPRAPIDTFITTAIAEDIMRNSTLSTGTPVAAVLPKQKTEADQYDPAHVEVRNQKRELIQLDVSKLAAGYTFTAPSLNDTDLGNDISGVSNTQATTPHSSELDLESTTRTLFAPVLGTVAFGIQNDFEFDHKRTGNTTGKPATITYQLNSETAGGFLQIHIPQILGRIPDRSLSIRGPRDLPRFYWVIAPYQYQRQIVGSPLYFGYLTPPYTKNPSQQLTVTVPVSDGFVWKSGLRYEAGARQAWSPDRGSYAEVGPEYVIQSHILNGISMPDLAGLSNAVTTHCLNPCLVAAGTSITSAVQAYYKDNNQTLSGASRLVPLTRTVHAGGLYWTIHGQKILNKAKTYSISFDSAGDSYLLPGFTLPTQTRYAINSKLAFNMNFLGNLSFSPTYSVFNFENQGAPAERVSVNTTSFEVMLKWFYGRDTQSPPFRLLWFGGPKSGDQTTSTKLK